MECEGGELALGYAIGSIMIVSALSLGLVIRAEAKQRY